MKTKLLNVVAGVLLTILLGLGGWAGATIISNSTAIAGQETGLHFIKESVKRVEKKVDRILENQNERR